MSWACTRLGSTVTQTYEGAGPAIYNAIQTFLTAQCIITPDLFLEPTPDVLSRITNQTYDFIIVGAGTAGSIVANRLSENPDWNVLVLEAGGNPTLATEVPKFFPNIFLSDEDWSFPTLPNNNASLSFEDHITLWARGKVLGGSSSTNFMFYVRGNKEDYNNWGLPGWSYDEILPYFKKSENVPKEYQEDIDMKYHGEDGPYSVQRLANDPMEDLLVHANEELGLPYNNDFNGENQIGVAISFINIKNGERQSTLNTFLKPIRDRPNLTVVKHVTVDKVLIEILKAKGVQATTEDGIIIQINATKEVIISAGTVMSPVILLKSGIGPNKESKHHCKNNKQKPKEHILDLPVGENLQDQVFTLVIYKMKSNDTLSTSLPAQFEGFYQYVTENRTGPLSNLKPMRVVTFINTTDFTSKTPDIQNFFLVLNPKQESFYNILKGYNFGNDFTEKFIELNQDHAMILIFTVLLQPKSRGSITLDEYNNPMIDTQTLAEDDDLDTLVRGVKLDLKLANTKVFKDLSYQLHWIEIDACEEFDKETDEYLKCYIRHVSGNFLHAVGTNKMADDDTAVVDAALNVKSVETLRVIDLSVAPIEIRGNTMATAMMIAEKGADLVKGDYS